MTSNQIRSLLAQALKDRAPASYEQLKEGQMLDRYLDRLAGSVLETRSDLEEQAMGAVNNSASPEYQKDSMKAIQKMNSRKKAAEEIAVAHAIESIDALSKPSETYKSMETLPPGPIASDERPKLPVRLGLILENLERNKDNPPKRRKPTPSNVVPFRKPAKR